MIKSGNATHRTILLKEGLCLSTIDDTIANLVKSVAALHAHVSQLGAVQNAHNIADKKHLLEACLSDLANHRQKFGELLKENLRSLAQQTTVLQNRLGALQSPTIEQVTLVQQVPTTLQFLQVQQGPNDSQRQVSNARQQPSGKDKVPDHRRSPKQQAPVQSKKRPRESDDSDSTGPRRKTNNRTSLPSDSSEGDESDDNQADIYVISGTEYNSGRWTEEEHMAAVRCIEQYGLDLDQLVKKIPSRDIDQIKGHIRTDRPGQCCEDVLRALAKFDKNNKGQ